MKLTEEHGPIFRISVPGTGRVFVSDPDLVDPVCDDSELHKKVAAAVKTASHSVAGTGLFTTEYDDPIWQKAPNILMAPFS
ncbi:MAG: hypothetical protein WA892_01630 [Ornithinimicrobium sp.]